MVCSVADPRRQTGIFFSEGVIGYWKKNGLKNRFAARLSNWRNQHTAIHSGGLDHFDSDIRIFHCRCNINVESSPRLQSNGILRPFRDAISEFGWILHIHTE